VSTTTIAFERPSDIARWRRAGYVGVEMEAAATLAVAARYGVRAAGAFVLLDNLAADHTVFSLTDDERARVRAAREPMTRAAVSALTRAMD
jgi:uridine phosphorylase